MMTKDDKREIIEIFTDCIKGVIMQQDTKMEINIERTNSQFSLIKVSLNELSKDIGEVKEQTYKTNGRVTSLEKEVSNHPMACPGLEKMRKIEDQTLIKNSLKSWVIASLAFVGSMAGTAYAIIKIYEMI